MIILSGWWSFREVAEHDDLYLDWGREDGGLDARQICILVFMLCGSFWEFASVCERG
jgi:hypothetical protein